MNMGILDTNLNMVAHLMSFLSIKHNISIYVTLLRQNAHINRNLCHKILIVVCMWLLRAFLRLLALFGLITILPFMAWWILTGFNWFETIDEIDCL